MKYLLFFLKLFLISLLSQMANAQGTITLRTQPTVLAPGDTMLLEATYQNPGKKLPKYATLHVWLEDVNHIRKWKLRYPLIDGVATAALLLPDSLPPAVYAITCLVQREMVHVLGRLKNKNPPDSINVAAMDGKRLLFAKVVKIDGYGNFQVPNLLFENKATVVFTPFAKTKSNWLDVDMEAPVDSVFFPLAKVTRLYAFGVPFEDTTHVKYAMADPNFKDTLITTLQNVVVTAKLKTNADKYADQYVSGFFQGEGFVFDGIDNPLLSSSLTVIDFLASRVAGLNISVNPEDSQRVSWRGFEPAYFVDEIQTDIEGIMSIPTSDIALVKVMRPPFYGVSMGSAGGAIAVYTKKEKGNYGNYGNRFRFVITGYTPQIYKLVL